VAADIGVRRDPDRLVELALRRGRLDGANEDGLGR
jgi:hypothetical protein